MPTEYLIEVCAEPGDTTTQKGGLLEQFSKLFIASQGLQATTTVRLTGIEVDLLCNDTQSGETVVVECKAYRSTISADVLTKLYGTVVMKSYAAGWLISTHALGKDAKGLAEEWKDKNPDERRRLRVFTPDILVPRLIEAGVVCSPDALPIDATLRRSSEAYLLISKRGNYWAVPIVDLDTGVAASVAIFDAKSGAPIRNATLLAWLLQTDTTLSNLSPVGLGSPDAAVKLKQELDNIVGVPMADHWADYRPSRPTDFVGRESIQADIFDFFEQVRTGSTGTRLLALKAPSGWGKSSSVLKIANRARSRGFRSKFFVHAVDSRAAATDRFPELALVSALKSAMAEGFIKSSPIQLGSAGSIFTSDDVKRIADDLREQGRVICLFFDQFEELLYKEELSTVFDSMRAICNAIEEAQANICVGFSWKTDGTITTDHGAYHLWHSLSDRRYEINLPPFDEREVSTAIGKFGKELGEPVAIQLRRLLEDHCQGYPWLLKKLCVNILLSVKAGAQQSDLLASSLNIGSLFQKDLEELTAPEIACLKHIGRDSPAEFFSVVDTFGEVVVSNLINKRLVIRSGVRLALYWDIFREFVLTERVPNIPVTYVPQANLSRYLTSLKYLCGKPSITYSELSHAMQLTPASTDNLVRDLANLGHVEALRSDGVLTPLFTSEEEAFSISHRFWRSHDLVQRLDSQFGDSPFSIGEFVEICRQAYGRKTYADSTLNMYARRVLNWFDGVNLINEVVDDFYALDMSPSARSAGFFDSQGIRRKRAAFLAEAPPEAVVALVEALKDGPVARSSLERLVSRNAVSAGLSLGVANLSGAMVQLSEMVHPVSPVGAVCDAARNRWTIAMARDLIAHSASIKSDEIASRIAFEMGADWSQGSLMRYGSALRRWAVWTDASCDVPTNGQDQA